MRKFFPFLIFPILCADARPVVPMPKLKAVLSPFEVKIEAPVKKPEKKVVKKIDQRCEADKSCGLILPRTAITIEEDGKGVYRSINTKVWNIRIETNDKCEVVDEMALILIEEKKTNRLIQAPVREGECIRTSNGCMAMKVEDISYGISEGCKVTDKKIKLSFSASRHY